MYRSGRNIGTELAQLRTGDYIACIWPGRTRRYGLRTVNTCFNQACCFASVCWGHSTLSKEKLCMRFITTDAVLPRGLISTSTA